MNDCIGVKCFNSVSIDLECVRAECIASWGYYGIIMRVTKVKKMCHPIRKSQGFTILLSSLFVPLFFAFQLVYPISTMDVECTLEHNTELITRKIARDLL